jgi:hypothetical protein
MSARGLNQNYYYKECNENYGNEKPWFPSINCSAHGHQIQQNNFEDGYWCDPCEEEAFRHAYVKKAAVNSNNAVAAER